MAFRTLSLAVEHFPLKAPFRIAGHVFRETSVLVAEIREGAHVGRGEGAGVYYLGDDSDHMLELAEYARPAIEKGADRETLARLLPAGGARNALDCALWSLEAHLSGTAAWQLAGLAEPRPLRSTLTIGADSPVAMADLALTLDRAAPIKLKLTGEPELDSDRVRYVRKARPDAWIAVDANQGYARDTLPELLPVLVEAEVAMLEQPLPRGQEADLDGLERPLPFAADESALTLADTPSLVGRFDVVNIKLDKCGGLTEALAIARQARELGLGVMVGNMVGTSLSMAPAFLVGQLCDIVDLDGPIFLARDRQPGCRYFDGLVDCPEAVWP
ncbi:MAG: dipeptide epimerase [Sphingomonadaceae bacterium]